MTPSRFLYSTIISVSLFVASPSPAAGQKGSPDKKAELKWTDVESAMKAAAEQERAVLVDVYTDWCGWCKKMDKEVFNDPKVSDVLARRFTLARVNAESREKVTFKDHKTDGIGFAQGFGINGYPSLIFLDSKGDVLTLIPGYVDAENFLPIVMFLGEKQYEKMEWEAYLAEYTASKKSSSPAK